MKSFIKEWGFFLLIITLFILSRIFIWSPVKVDGHSMDPTLRDSERLIMVKTASIKRFDVVVASEPDANGKTKLIVKRIIGMPGDTIRYENDKLYINDKNIDEPYLEEYLQAFANNKLQEEYSFSKNYQQVAQAASHFTLDASGNSNFTVSVPEGEYFLMGDDRLISLDSRRVGTFKQSAIEGKVLFRIWPLNRFGTF